MPHYQARLGSLSRISQLPCTALLDTSPVAIGPIVARPWLLLPRGCGRDRTCHAKAPDLQSGCTTRCLASILFPASFGDPLFEKLFRFLFLFVAGVENERFFHDPPTGVEPASTDP